MFTGIPIEWLPNELVAVVALALGAAFLGSDWRSPTSRSLATAFIAFAVSIGLAMPLGQGGGTISPAFRWLALADAVGLICALEWIRRVRRTIDVEHLHVGASEFLLRIGQVCAGLYGLIGVADPQLRRDEILGAVHGSPGLAHPGFWMLAGPVAVSLVTGAIATILLLAARPDRSERVRLLAAVFALPAIIAGLLLPVRIGSILMMSGLMIFMVGVVQYLVHKGERAQFLARFLSPQVEKLVRDRGLKRAVQHRTLEISCVYSDLRGFTAFAQSHPSSSVIKTLREYYDAVGKVVAEYGATVKDYAGDGILILVGAPLPIENHAAIALEMAWGIRNVAAEVTRRWSTSSYPLGIGVGVASGLVTVGILGSASRWEYVAVGPAVNLAARLCQEAQHNEVLVDARTAELAGTTGLVPREPMSVKGFSEPVVSYGLAL